jgi:hypothetical protein
LLSETGHPPCARFPAPGRISRPLGSRIKCVVLALGVSLAACSSESPPDIEPEVQHAGAFVAVGDAELALYRTLKALRIEGDIIMFTTLYDVVPETFDQARAIAQQSSIPIRQELVTVSKAMLTRHRNQVVWFRTLTKEEENRSP